MCMLAKYAIESHTGLEYAETSLMQVRRGNVISAHSIGKTNTLTGKYINLFDDKLTVLESVTVPRDDSVMLYDISGLSLDVPRIGFTGGKLAGSVTETAEKTVFSIYGPADTIASTRILAPEGTYPVSVSATRGGNPITAYRVWSNATSSLLVQLDCRPEEAQITVTWGNTPVGDDSNVAFKDIRVPTNDSNQDKEYIVTNTAGVNSGLRFCDVDRELIYKFELAKYPNAQLTFFIVQNYILEYSLDNKTWTVIADYSKIGEWTDRGDNSTYYTVYPNEVGAKDVIYIRLRNTTPSKGWGGSITSFRIRYTEG